MKDGVEEKTDGIDVRSGDQSAPIPEEIASELGRSMRGRSRWFPLLVQRAASEGPRWTRAVGDQSSPPSMERRKSGGRSTDAVGIHLTDPHEMGGQVDKLTVNARCWNLSIC